MLIILDWVLLLNEALHHVTQCRKWNYSTLRYYFPWNCFVRYCNGHVMQFTHCAQSCSDLHLPTWFLGPFSTRPLELERSLGTRLPAGFQLEPCHRLLAVWKRQTVIKTRAMPVSLRSRAQVPATPAGDFASKLNWIKVTLRARSMDCIFQWEYMK